MSPKRAAHYESSIGVCRTFHIVYLKAFVPPRVLKPTKNKLEMQVVKIRDLITDLCYIDFII